MNKYKVSFLRLRVFIIAVIIGGSICLAGVVWSSNKSQKSQLNINNLTQTCHVINAEKHDGSFKLSIRNDSQKNITAFVISSVLAPGSIFSVKEELAYSEINSVIAPGSIYEKEFGLPGSLNSRKNITIDLAAVVFDDKSSEGDPQIVRGIEDERAAEKVLISRAIPIFEKLSGLSNAKMESYFNSNLKHDLLTALETGKQDLLIQVKKDRPQLMSQIEAGKLPEEMEMGLHNGREYFLQKMMELETIKKTEGETALREEITRTKRICEQILSRL